MCVLSAHISKSSPKHGNLAAPCISDTYYSLKKPVGSPSTALTLAMFISSHCGGVKYHIYAVDIGNQRRVDVVTWGPQNFGGVPISTVDMGTPVPKTT